MNLKNIFNLLSDKEYSDKERNKIDDDIKYGNYEQNNNNNPYENHCTDKNCPFFAEEIITKGDEELCPECGAYTTYFYRKQEDI